MTTKVAVITGAAQGIGRRTAELLRERGYALATIDLRPSGLGGVDFTGDISDEATVERFAAATRELGPADVLVNNAGVSFIAKAQRTSAADYRRVLEINLVAPFLLARVFGADMLAAGRGSIVNVASVAGLLGVSERVAYNASKHGLVGLTRTLAAEWGGRGVRVNAVCPGWVKTDMDDSAQAGGHYSDDDITGRVPMARFASADDVARAIAFLADSGESGFVNGHTLVVDGGWTADGSWQSLRLSRR